VVSIYSVMITSFGIWITRILLPVKMIV